MSEAASSRSLVPTRDNTKLAFWLFIGSEIVFFTVLILTFLLDRMSDPSAFAEFRDGLSIPIIAVNTFILISSSYMVVRSFEAIRHGRVGSLARNLIGVAVLGTLFLAGQALEWATLFGAGESFKSTFGTPFFTVTGIHGTHVFVGLIWCIVLILLARRGTFSQAHHDAIELFGLYWHFVDIVWIVLFTVIYLI
jgi:heme/copper-type cytochrome/quinol oxidase subunit 3